jgi:hypothetical protein
MLILFEKFLCCTCRLKRACLNSLCISIIPNKLFKNYGYFDSKRDLNQKT